MAAADFDVIVAGAGYAGITAARDMSDRGLSVLVLEASERVGGRAFSSVFSGRDELVEHGAQWINQSVSHNMRREIQRYDIKTVGDVAPESVTFCTEERGGRFGCHGLSDPDPTSLEMAQEAIEFYFPEGRVVASDAHDWNRDPWFDGTYRIEAPGRAHAFPRIMNVPEGQVFFAGSDMAPSVFRSFWMEGAIESGHLAAEKVLASLSVPAESRRQRQIAT